MLHSDAGSVHQNGDAELIRANRLQLGVSLIAVVLLGPSFIAGYLTGSRSASARGSQSAPGPALVAPAQSALPAQSAPQRSASTEQQTPAGPVRAKKPAVAARAGQPAAAQVYLQLVAVSKSRSTVLIDVLRKNGFPAVPSEVPEKPSLCRVLIGPLRPGDLDKTRADLQSKGFPGAYAIKKTF